MPSHTARLGPMTGSRGLGCQQYIDIVMMNILGGDLNSVICLRVTSPEEFSIDEQYSLIYILHFVSAVSP